MNVNITSTKVEFLSKGTSIVFRGDDLLRGQVIQNPAGQGSIVRLTLSKEARDVAGADFYDINPLSIENQPTWTDKWEEEGVFTCLEDLTPLLRKCCASGGGGGGTVDTITAGDGIEVDSADPANPEVSAKVDGTTIGFNGSGELEAIGSGSGITSLTTDVVATGPGAATAIIQADVVTNTKLANMAQATLKGRASGAGTGDPTDLTANQASTILDGATDPFVRTSNLPNAGITQLTGDVTAGPGSGSQSSTIANSAVTYAKIQNVSATDRLLGRSTAGAGVVEEITCTAAGRAILDDTSAASQRVTLGLGNIGVPITLLATSSQINNQALAVAFISNAIYGPILDLTGFTQVNFQCGVSSASASANTPKIILRYFNSFTVTASNYLDIGTSEVSVSLSALGVYETGWIDLAAGAIGPGMYIRLLGSGGDGVADPIITSAMMFLR